MKQTQALIFLFYFSSYLTCFSFFKIDDKYIYTFSLILFLEKVPPLETKEVQPETSASKLRGKWMFALLEKTDVHGQAGQMKGLGCVCAHTYLFVFEQIGL